jgi:tetratricopeptide (TPR) repeat protein
MHSKSWLASAALASALALTGCNIFNPNGAANASCSGSDVDCYMALGQALIQDEDFQGAIKAYEKAIALDSTRSEAYFGYSRATVYAFNVNMGSLLGDISEASNNMNVFMEHPDAVLTQRIQMAYQVLSVMDIMVDRDTLNTAWLYLSDSGKYKNRSDYATRKAFITAYLEQDSAGPSRKREKFPLMDGEKTFEHVAIDFVAYKMLFKIMDFNDVGRDRIFNASDKKLAGLLNADGTFGNLEDLAADMENDTALQNDVNTKILELQNGMGDIQSLLGLLGVSSDSSGGTKQQTGQKLDTAIQGLGGALVFYQFGDKLDNDADGCLDEEIADSADNDYDGFVDEDARVRPGNGALVNSTGPADSLDNDRNGLKDGLDGLGSREVTLSYRGPLTFAAGLFGEGGDNVWIKPNAKKGRPLMDYRIALQADSLASKLDPTVLPYVVPMALRPKLDSAINLIGGCWRNYKNY